MAAPAENNKRLGQQPSFPWRRRVVLIGLVSAVFAGGILPASQADTDLGSNAGQVNGSGTVTSNLKAIVNFTLTDSAIALGTNITTAAGVDTFEDSHETSGASNDSIALNASGSNLNAMAFLRRDFFNTTAKAVGQSNAATLADIDYQTTSLTGSPKVQQCLDGSVYRQWAATGANSPCLWIFFDDGYEAGAVNSANDFTLAGGVATAANAGNFTPYMISMDSDTHDNATNVPAASYELPTLKWSDASTSISTSDYVLQGSVVYYNESGSPASGSEGSLQEKYVQVIMRASGGEVYCRQGGASSGGQNWSALTGWDLAVAPNGNLNSTGKAPDSTCSLFGNRYALSFSDTASATKRMVLSLAQNLPLTIGQVGGTQSSLMYAAMAFPKEAPRLDYSVTAVLDALPWAPHDALSSTADNVQYP